jgi:hypothetical protein
VASKFFEHFVAIAEAINKFGGSGLWDQADGFYYDQLNVSGKSEPLRIRSMVGIIPLFTAELLSDAVIDGLPGFAKRMRWFLENRPIMAGLGRQTTAGTGMAGFRLLALPTRERLVQVLKRVLDETEFLSPFGVRSLSRIHSYQPFEIQVGGMSHRVRYEPGESSTNLFGGNSNWRGPIWFPLNYLLIEALERYHAFYGDALKVECPTGSGHLMTLDQVAQEIGRRLTSLFLPDEHGARPVHGGEKRYATDPYWRDLVLFYEYFHGDTGRGLGASHQTGWTALAVRLLRDLTLARSAEGGAQSAYVPLSPVGRPEIGVV